MNDDSILDKIGLLTIRPSMEDYSVRMKMMYSLEELTDLLFEDTTLKLVEINLAVNQKGKPYISFIAEKENDEQ